MESAVECLKINVKALGIGWLFEPQLQTDRGKE